MQGKQILRTLIIGATACYLIWFFLPFLASDLEQKIGAYSGHGALLPVNHPAYPWIWMVIWLVAAVGVYLFQNWGRFLYLALTILGPVLAPFSGYVIQPALDTAFSNANLILDGAVLAVAFLSPVSKLFKNP